MPTDSGFIGKFPNRVAVLFVGLLTFGACDRPPGPVGTPPIHTPRWAFRPWISKDISTTDDSYRYVQGFIDRKIPVGVLVVDSPWETDYNNYTPNPVRYHDFGKLVRDLRAKDVRMVLWTTQMVNVMSFDAEPMGDSYPDQNQAYLTAKKNGYCVDDGALYDWWKGTGCGIDFFNGGAREFWHGLQDQVLDVGVAGWKLDFGDTYLTSDPVKTADGLKPHQAYSEEYYRDYYGYGVERVGAEEFLTMVRPWDKSYQWPGRFFARPEHAPVTWVGDNRRDFVGLSDALNEIFISARAGYVVIGSDIGGYLDVNDENLLEAVPFDAEVYLRWLAVGAITPFMQLHGRANQEPWSLPQRSDEAVASYRYWASLHEALVPYFYSLAEEAYAKRRGPIIDPVGDPASWAGDFRFSAGDALFCAPLVDGTGAREVALPAGTRYFDWWDDAAGAIDGGTTVHRDYKTSGQKIPLFAKEGSIIPLDGNPAGSGLDATLASAIGLPASGGALVALVWPGPKTATFALHDADGVSLLGASTTGSTISFTVDRASRPILLRVRQDAAPKGVTSGTALAQASSLAALSTTTGWWHDPAAPYTWIRVDPNVAGLSVVIQ